MFKQQHCSQVTWPRPISSHMWLSGKKEKEKWLWILFGLLGLQCRCFSDPRRPPWEAPADLPHLPPPAACGEPPGRERRPHHPGLLQEAVRPRCRAGSEDHHESFGTGLTQVPAKTNLSWATWPSDRSTSHVFLWNFPSYACLFEAVPVKISFVEYTVQECAQGLTERGTCQQPTPDSDTEVIKQSSGSFQHSSD